MAHVQAAYKAAKNQGQKDPGVCFGFSQGVKGSSETRRGSWSVSQVMA